MMEFDFDIDKVLKDSITLVAGNHSLLNQRNSYADLQQIIDTIGSRSAKAQKLSSSITSLSKLRINAHRIYILTNKTSNTRATSVIGFIKVGTKQLFVLDHEGTHHQTHPLCVLDFYIHESHQRMGYGLKLFKHMLELENVHPSHLAIDRPSQKFTSFLRKHFHLWATIPQVNNFVVFEGFFKNREGKKRKNFNHPSKNYDEFRPLSRAVTEGVLHSHKGFTDSNTLNGIRPASNTHAEGDYRYTQDHVPYRHSNMFSRYTNNERYAPSQVERRHSTRQSDKIVTNPYRSSPNQRTQTNGESAKRATPSDEELSQNGKSPTLDLNSISNSPISDEVLFDRNYSSKDSTAKLFQANEKWKSSTKKHDPYPRNMTEVYPAKQHPQKELFKAKINGNSISSYRYRNPSDMIDELKKKDQEIGNRNPSYLHRYALGSSSWNVFGIPSPSRFANR